MRSTQEYSTELSSLWRWRRIYHHQFLIPRAERELNHGMARNSSRRGMAPIVGAGEPWAPAFTSRSRRNWSHQGLCSRLRC